MGLLFGGQKRDASLGSLMAANRQGMSTGSVSIDSSTAMRQSAVWAAIRLRADLISTLPLDVFRKVGGVQVEVEKPPVFIDPSGNGIAMEEWLYSTQVDLDRVGNCFGLITSKDGFGIPNRIELVAHTDVTVLVDKDTHAVRYRIAGKVHERADVWHEKQFTVAGLAVGLSPIANAAWTLGVYQSAQAFALEWFANGGSVPNALLRNTKKILQPGEADTAKTRFKAAITNRDVFVTGNDWEYTTVNSAASDAKFLESQNLSDIAAARFFGVPADTIDVPVDGSHITYASVAAKNLQLLIMNLGPAITRRERALGKLVQAPRFVKFNRGALLQMDPETVSKVLIAELGAGLRFPSEARELLDLPPQTSANLAELAALQEALSKKSLTPIGAKT